MCLYIIIHSQRDEPLDHLCTAPPFHPLIPTNKNGFKGHLS